MVPGDLASRLRGMIEPSVQPLSFVNKTPSNLPDFSTGQRFTAQIQTPLPDGTFQALVAGKNMTLALPHSVKSGDVLELVVTGQREQVIVARTLTPPELANLKEASQSSLSQTGRLISQLLTGRYGEAQTLPLSKGKALQSKSASVTPEKLAASLKQAVSQSGLFYESHLKSWAEGKLPLSELIQEPQAKIQLPPQIQASQNNEASTGSFASFLQDVSSEDNTTLEESLLLPSILKESESDSSMVKGKEAPVPNARPEQTQKEAEDTLTQKEILIQKDLFSTKEIKNQQHSIPESMMPLIYQQLETLATNQMQWQFQPWPGMDVEWELVSPDKQKSSDGEEEKDFLWRSQLRMHLPNLGDVKVLLIFGPSGLNISLDANSDQSARLMRMSSQTLVDALATAGVSVKGFAVNEHASA